MNRRHLKVSGLDFFFSLSYQGFKTPRTKFWGAGRSLEQLGSWGSLRRPGVSPRSGPAWEAPDISAQEGLPRAGEPRGLGSVPHRSKGWGGLSVPGSAGTGESPEALTLFLWARGLLCVLGGRASW